MDILLAYVAGLLTLLNPCVLPVLSIIFVGALQTGPRTLIATLAGLAGSFIALGLLINVAGPSIGLTQTAVSNASAIAMMLFGGAMLMPALGQQLSRLAAVPANWASQHLHTAPHRSEAKRAPSIRSDVLGGVLLGAVWSPCIGPTVGAAIALANRGDHLIWVTAVLGSFVAGVCTGFLAFGRAGQHLIAPKLKAVTVYMPPALGGLFVAYGFTALTGAVYTAEAWLLQQLPPWIIDLSVMF